MRLIKFGSGVPMTKEEGENIGVEEDFFHGVCRLRLSEPIDLGKHLIYVFVVRDDAREDLEVLYWAYSLSARKFS
jgi:hypothetical protein